MKWQGRVLEELAKGTAAQRLGNHGKARTCARRAVGIAVSELQREGLLRDYEADFMHQVRRLSEDAKMPEEVRRAAEKLSARLAENFAAQSTEPIDDANIILRHLDSLREP